METILKLFSRFFDYFAIATMLLPIVTSIIARKKKKKFNSDLKLFELYIYFTFIMQIFSLVLVIFFHKHNVILFRIYMPIHIMFFCYLLLKWAAIVKNILPFVILIGVTAIVSDYYWGISEYTPDLMFWIDAVVLFILSCILIYRIDKMKVKLPGEFIFILYGIFLYSFFTLIGITPAFEEIRMYGFLVQSIGVVISNYFFGRSFMWLYR